MIRPKNAKKGRGRFSRWVASRVLAFLFLGICCCSNAFASDCKDVAPHASRARDHQTPPPRGQLNDVAVPSQPSPCAVNQPRNFWQHFDCGEPVAYSALGTMVAAIIAAVIGLIALRINANTVRGQRIHEQIRMVLEIDKEMIGRPELWAIYEDENVPDPRETDATLPWRKKALVFSYFNMFDFVYGFYERRAWMWLKPWPYNRDRQDWRAWENYMKSFFAKSEFARGLWKSNRDSGIYPKSFTRFVNKKLLPPDASSSTAPNASTPAAKSSGTG
jgi:hypothetical protein